MKFLDDKMKKMLIFLAVLILLVIVFAFVIFLTGDKTLSYSQIENKMLEASRQYFLNNKGALPSYENGSMEVSADLLAEEGYMKAISKYQENSSVACSGKVTVIKNGEYYYYSPYLNCGDKYTTTYLDEKLLDSLVTDKDGLYAMNQIFEGKSQKMYVYRGEFPNNYVLIDGTLWRIVKINPDRTIMIIQAKVDDDTFEEGSWDDRYNLDDESNSGINVFSDSRIKRRLDIYYSSDNYFSSKLKEKLVPKKVCIGARNIEQSKNDGSIECSKKSEEEQYFSLLPMYDFLNASLDSYCKLPEDRNCSNYNYLNKFGDKWWLLTVNSKATYRGFMVSSSIYRSDLSANAHARLVAYLNSNVTYAGGSGTYRDPYLVR